MGFFDWFAQEARCPNCGHPGAKKFLWQVKCRNLACTNFDRSLLYEQPETARRSERPAEQRPPLTGSFDPGSQSIRVRYRNFRGEDKTFVGNRTTIVSKRNHLSLRLSPTGMRVAFSRDRIGNLDELESLVPKEADLTPLERQVIGYHKKHGTTSPLYESIRRKYPDL